MKRAGIAGCSRYIFELNSINPLNAELNPIRHLLALAGAHHFVDVSRIRVNNSRWQFLSCAGTAFDKPYWLHHV
jgi:hypothetical protein